MHHLFLMRLRHMQLPARITDPADIRAVSVLLATGLIEAQIPPLGSTARYTAPRAATVVRITPEGQAELTRLWDTRPPLDGSG